MSKAQNSWTPKIRNGKGAAYLQIANAIADDVAIGVLTVEQRLPPQRKLATLLGLDFTTVVRAYNEANCRGLVDSVVGRGTFVCGRRRPKVPRAVETRANVDMSMNMPPKPFTPQLLQLMQLGMADVGARMHDLLRYQDFCGSVQDRDAGALAATTGHSGEPGPDTRHARSAMRLACRACCDRRPWLDGLLRRANLPGSACPCRPAWDPAGRLNDR